MLNKIFFAAVAGIYERECKEHVHANDNCCIKYCPHCRCTQPEWLLTHSDGTEKQCNCSLESSGAALAHNTASFTKAARRQDVQVDTKMYIRREYAFCVHGFRKWAYPIQCFNVCWRNFARLPWNGCENATSRCTLPDY